MKEKAEPPPPPVRKNLASISNSTSSEVTKFSNFSSSINEFLNSRKILLHPLQHQPRHRSNLMELEIMTRVQQIKSHQVIQIML